ncbi:MAG: HAMP domain-containing sensor histidine kinase [Thermoanaerobaculia bacterium]
MVRAIFSKLTSVSRDGLRSYRVSIIVAFGIISIAVSGLAWRSYNLSSRMELGANTLAVQYAGYAADITARRVDAALRTELSRASEEWQQLERRIGDPTVTAVRDWMNDFDWIITAIYVPDLDPASSIFVSEVGGPRPSASKTIAREFFTSSGMVRYSYDPDRLLAQVQGAVRQQPLVRTAMPDALEVQQSADVSVVKIARRPGVQRSGHAFTFYSPLAAPMDAYSIKAVVRASYAGSGWENQRLISLGLSLLAIVLTAVGAYLAIHGLSKEAETMKLRGDLIASVSHELRTPLSMIRLGAETLKLPKLKDKERSDIQEQILREVLLLSHLVENVLDVARIQNRSTKALAFTSVLPQTLITGVLDTYASWIASKGFAVAFHVDDEVAEQMWDRDAVSRALLNLIDNAIKYSGDEDRTIDVRLRQTASEVVVEVTDHGIGIAARDAARIFDPYYRAQFSDTTTRRGAGLGLTLVHQIVTSHGGRVELESTPGEGSTFRLLFPRAIGARNDDLGELEAARQAY